MGSAPLVAPVTAVGHTVKTALTVAETKRRSALRSEEWPRPDAFGCGLYGYRGRGSLGIEPRVDAVLLGPPHEQSFVEHGDFGKSCLDELLRQRPRLRVRARAVANQPSVLGKIR